MFTASANSLPESWVSSSTQESKPYCPPLAGLFISMQKFITCKGCGAQWYVSAERVPWSYNLIIHRSLLICRECATENIKTKRIKPPHFDLPTVGSAALTLIVKTAANGERVRKEMDAAAI